MSQLAATRLRRLRALCRVCLHNRGVIDILSSPTSEMLLTFTEISNDVRLSDSICTKCSVHLEQAFTFRDACEKSNIKLIKLLQIADRSDVNESEKAEENLIQLAFTETKDEKNQLTTNIESLLKSLGSKGEINIATNTSAKTNNFKVNKDQEYEDKILNEESIDEANFEQEGGLLNSNNEEDEILISGNALNIYDLNVQYYCECCEQIFTTNAELEKHYHVYENELYNCEDCGKVRKGADHVGILKQAKAFIPCEICGKVYKRQNIQQHIETVHQRQPKKCSICHRISASTHGLKTHIWRAHGTPKTLTCDICAKTYKSKNGILAHMSQHSGVRPYPCNNCGKTFCSVKSRKLHERVHTGEKPYSCPVCDRRFRQSGNVKCHFIRYHPYLDYAEAMKSKKLNV